MLLFEDDINLIWAVLIFFILYMLVAGTINNYFHNRAPKLLTDTFGYGKTAEEKPMRLVELIGIRKAYFLHFYVFATAWINFCFMMLIHVTVFEHATPSWFMDFLNLVSSQKRIAGTTSEAAMLALILMYLQCVRRLYECAFVNIDTGSKMNILHYIVGFVHYFCAGVGILSEAPGFVTVIKQFPSPVASFQWLQIDLNVKNITFVQWFFAGVSIWAMRHQLTAHRIFADLKRNSGRDHAIPFGDWFQFVTCPHYLAEIILYMCIAAILGPEHQTGWLIFFWVVVNQLVAGVMQHKWYKRTFRETYPSNRKAVIPFIF